MSPPLCVNRLRKHGTHIALYKIKFIWCVQDTSNGLTQIAFRKEAVLHPPPLSSPSLG